VEAAVIGTGELPETRERARDRRQSTRHRSFAEHGIARARLRPGLDVELVEISAAGALIETSRPLRPGAVVELQLEVSGERATARGRVVRCEVASLIATRVSYRGAIGFEARLAWFAEETGGSGYVVPSAEDVLRRNGREEATRRAP
jgi:hypothetical protein